jgi:hypothetical protein
MYASFAAHQGFPRTLSAFNAHAVTRRPDFRRSYVGSSRLYDVMFESLEYIAQVQNPSEM